MILKPVFLIAIAVVCLIIIFFGLSIFDIDDIANIQVTPFDCAKTFDSLTFDNINGIISEEHFEGLYQMTENRCWITLDSWLDNSKYNSLKNTFDYEYQYSLSHKGEQNQLILGEITCKDIQKNPSQYYYGKNFDLERCEKGVKTMKERHMELRK